MLRFENYKRRYIRRQVYFLGFDETNFCIFFQLPSHHHFQRAWVNSREMTLRRWMITLNKHWKIGRVDSIEYNCNFKYYMCDFTWYLLFVLTLLFQTIQFWPYDLLRLRCFSNFHSRYHSLGKLTIILKFKVISKVNDNVQTEKHVSNNRICF